MNAKQVLLEIVKHFLFDYSPDDDLGSIFLALGHKALPIFGKRLSGISFP